ncbi:hypothetical protein [Nocardia sp. NPDC057440]|uniref:hypothetical protein n=1 Tax=Nocardia sp. NPDC057440 TaxID=3346134 RepID=UPI00366DB447
MIGHQTPRILAVPGSALRVPHGDPDLDVESLGDEAIELAELTGLTLDQWQRLCIRQMAAIREDTYSNPYTGQVENKWAASEFGLMVSRQNGKGSILEARELAGLFLWGERLIIHSAHLFPTAIEAFNRILMLIQNTPDLDREVKRVVNSHGEEGIHLKSGQRLLFKARSSGNVRGFTGDTIVFDEAMKKLGSSEIKALMPSVSARPNPQLIYTGSAGNHESEHFGRMRNRALAHLAGEKLEQRLAWIEWSANSCNLFCRPDCDEHDRPGDPETWAIANPAMGIRLDEAWIRDVEYQSMTRDDFAMERLGVGDWPSDGNGWRVIPREKWSDQGNESSQLVGKFALAVDSAPDASWTAISAAGINSDDEFHIEITGLAEQVDYRPGIKWVADRVEAIYKLYKVPFVVISRDSPAGTLIEELESRGIKVVVPSSRDYALACGDLKSGIAPVGGETPNVTHTVQTPLTTAVAAADKKPMQDLWVFSKSLSNADITPLVCVTLALWGYKQHIYRKRAKPFVVFA